MLVAIATVSSLVAQSVNDGIKMLNYNKVKSARTSLQAAYNANGKDPLTIYWYGQSLLAEDVSGTNDLKGAKEVYQKALQDGVNNAWVWVGMGHVEILQGGDLNAAKQKFEQAITAVTETKGRKKGQADPSVLNAIGRAMSDGGSKSGDPLYGIDKLKQAATNDLTNPDIMVNMGICYLKMGGENGGEAVKAFQEAITRDPKNARAMYRIGSIYYSQQNKELWEMWFNNTMTADPAYPAVYYKLYEYYANRDVNKAKEYLDKYISSADKDCQLNYLQGDYLFRAGKYAESLAKADEMENGDCKGYYRNNLLFAYNNDRMGDSIKASTYLDKYFATAPANKLEPQDYEFAAGVYAKVAGNEDKAAGYIEKAMEFDTTTANRINYANKAAEIFGKVKNYSRQLDWYKRVIALKGGVMSEADHYRVTNTAFVAKDFNQAIQLAKNYMAAHPDKAQPYSFFKRSAMQSSKDSSVIVGHLNYLDSVYTVVGLDKYRKDIYLNEYFRLVYYVSRFNTLKKDPNFKVKTDGTRTEVVDQFLETCQKAVATTDRMMVLYPDAADDNNKFAADQKASIQKNIDYYSKPQGKQTTPSGTKTTASPAPKAGK